MGMDGSRGRLIVITARFAKILTRAGTRLQTLEGKRWWPVQSISLIGLGADVKEGVAEFEARKRQKGVPVRDAVSGLQPGSSLCARAGLAAESSFNFLEWVAPGCCTVLRNGWNIVKDCGVMGKLRDGRVAPICW